MPPIDCSILPYYHLGSIIITIYPDKDYGFNRAEVEVAKKGLIGMKIIYKNKWDLLDLRRIITNNLLQDVFPELINNLTAKELEKLNTDRGTLLELIKDPWHKKAHVEHN